VSHSGAGRDVPVEVHADGSVSAPVSARAADLVRRLAAAVGRPVQYAAVILSVDRGRSGHRSRVEATVQTVGLRVRGFAAGRTFDEALRDLDAVLWRRLEEGRERLRQSAGNGRAGHGRPAASGVPSAASYKYPRYVESRESLPKNAANEILKREL
jgi:hypothetical protein